MNNWRQAIYKMLATHPHNRSPRDRAELLRSLVEILGRKIDTDRVLNHRVSVNISTDDDITVYYHKTPSRHIRNRFHRLVIQSIREFSEATHHTHSPHS